MNGVFTYREAAKFLKVSERTIWGLVKAGRLVPVRIGRRVLISSEDMDNFIRASRVVVT